MGKKLLFLAALGVTALSGAQADAQNLVLPKNGVIDRRL